MKQVLPLLLFLVALCGCQRKAEIPAIGISPEDTLDDKARAALHLPTMDEITLATDSDTEFAKTLSPEVIAVVKQAVTPQSAEFRIVAARPAGDYLLLWIFFPGVMDGGADVIYSIEKKKIIGWFWGGESG